MSYLIKKDNKTNTITYMQYKLDGYKFTPKSKKNTSLQINQIVVINPQMIDKILTIKFNEMFKKIMTFVMKIIYSNEGNDDSSGAYALSEIDRLKSIIFNKYQKYLSSEKQKLFLSKLNYLENQLKMKMLLNMQLEQNYDLVEEKTHGRGR